jgi:hypothetical protein
VSKLSYEDVTSIVQSLRRSKLPQAMTQRKARYTTNTIPTTKPPYNTSDLDRFEDTFRADGVAQRGIIKRAYLVMGKHGKIVLDTTEEYDDEEERKAALQSVQNNAKYQEARKRMQKLHIKPEVNFHNNLMSGLIQSKVYGRSALEIIDGQGKKQRAYTEEGIELEPQGISIDQVALPQALHLCNSKRLGRVEIETQPNTWAFKGVHYLDINKGSGGMDDLFLADQIIYMANKDYHISPGSLYYGLSDLETVIDGSEAKRIAKQEDIKEIMKSCWAAVPIIKFLNANITNDQMQEVIDAIQPGLPMGTKQDIEAQMITMNANIEALPEVIDFLNRETIRDLGMPAFITGYEQIANYANSQQILLALKEIELDAERTWLADIIDKQWLNRYFYQLLGFGEDDEPEVKLKYEFSDVTFETNLDKVNAALPLFDRKLYSGEKVLKLADAEDEVDEYKIRYEEQKKLQEERFGMELRRMDMEETATRNQVSTTMQKRQAQQSKDLIYEKIKEKLDTI